MMLLTQAIKRALPKLYSNEGNPDPIIVVKWFLGGFTWYAYEGEEQPDGDWLFFGYVDGQFGELGYWTLSQLEGVRGQFGLRVERDLHWAPAPLSTVRGY